MKQVHIKYFAKLREERGTNEEQYSTGCASVGELYRELRNKYGLTLNTDSVRAAVNGDYAPGDTPLQDGDEIVFIPPVAGG